LATAQISQCVSTPHDLEPDDDDDAFIRLPDVLGVFPVGETTWAEGVADGRYPKGFLLWKRMGWRVRDIRRLLRDTANCGS
jgi:hypothetical protein